MELWNSTLVYCLMIVMVIIGIFLYFFIMHCYPNKKGNMLISALFLSESVGPIWVLSNRFILISVAALVFFYTFFCSSLKKRLKIIPYTILFFFFTLFFVVWVTVLFGSHYYINDLLEFSDDALQISDNWILVDLCKIISFCFNIGFEYYFVLPTPISLSNPFFIQFIVGIAISGTIISWVFDTIKRLIAPPDVTNIHR